MSCLLMAMTDSESAAVSSSASSAIRSYSDGPPWIFKGRAFYQLHAVKASVARRFVPPELKLVEAFGYTLGGLFLANYDSSPAGQFDEAVVIAGIVWNAPTSCAWAGRVLVDSEEARVHGRQEMGLPSHLASFSHRMVSRPNPASPSRPWWDARAWFYSVRVGVQRQPRKPKCQHSVEIVQRGRDSTTALPLCEILGIPRVQPAEVDFSESVSSPSKQGQELRWRGSSVQLYLPNFSGKTKDQPRLLKYSCALNCRVSVVAPARITDLTGARLTPTGVEIEEDEDDELRTGDVVSILKGKPLASIFFDEMVMIVEAPKVLIFEDSRNEQRNQEKLLNPAAAAIDPALGISASSS